ncbi:MAG: type II secretion system minor pseudopilin GspJ [Oleiphilaceae bacterium]|nr:type II secretion system minor pseudopilin GspJ [Oleiphilaceae bacterium]
MSRNHQTGFTLMEVLIAVTITAVIGLGVWQVVSGVVLSRDRVDEVADEFEALQRAFLVLQRDINQIVNRPIRNIYGDFEPALSSRSDAFNLSLTRQGWRNPLGHKRSELQRSAYEFTGEELRRRYWVSVDRGQEETSRDQLLLDQVTAFNVRFLDEDRNWVENWPPDDTGEAATGTNSRPQQPLPLGIELTLSHRRFGDLSRVFSLPDYDHQSAQGQLVQAGQASDPAEPDDSDRLDEEGAAQ